MTNPVRIKNAWCYEERPTDRDYNKHGGKRVTQVEIMPDGLSYCIRTGIVYGVIIEYEQATCDSDKQ